jgi:hypothetical protein
LRPSCSADASTSVTSTIERLNMSAHDEFQQLAPDEHSPDDLDARDVWSSRNVREKCEAGECRPRLSERHADEPKAGINVAS